MVLGDEVFPPGLDVPGVARVQLLEAVAEQFPRHVEDGMKVSGAFMNEIDEFLCCLFFHVILFYVYSTGSKVGIFCRFSGGGCGK